MAPNPNGGTPQKYFDADDEVWEALATDNPEDLKIYDNSVDLRVDEHIKGINGELSILCSQIGFDPGTLAFDQSKGMKTATEVVSENSKTYGTVKAHENNIRDSLIDMVHAIFDLAVRYGLTWDGVPVERLLSGGYDVAVTFDDSIIQDKEAELNQGVMLVNSGLLSKYTFLTDKKYGQGMTPEEAESELKRIAQEKSADVRTVDIFAAGRGVEI
jgi:A118 family predicted phage portal protein